MSQHFSRWKETNILWTTQARWNGVSSLITPISYRYLQSITERFRTPPTKLEYWKSKKTCDIQIFWSEGWVSYFYVYVSQHLTILKTVWYSNYITVDFDNCRNTGTEICQVLKGAISDTWAVIMIAPFYLGWLAFDNSPWYSENIW